MGAARAPLVGRPWTRSARAGAGAGAAASGGAFRVGLSGLEVAEVGLEVGSRCFDVAQVVGRGGVGAEDAVGGEGGLVRAARGPGRRSYGICDDDVV